MSCEGHMLLHFIYARIRWTDWSTSLFTRFIFASDAHIFSTKTSMAGCGLSWSSNVLSDFLGNYFTILRVCIKECHFLRNLKLEDCELIREITYKLQTFSAKRWKSVKYMTLQENVTLWENFFWMTVLCIREIEGVLPNMDNLSAKNCTLLTS